MFAYCNLSTKYQLTLDSIYSDKSISGNPTDSVMSINFINGTINIFDGGRESYDLRF